MEWAIVFTCEECLTLSKWNGVLLRSEGWVNIGHGPKMFLEIGSENMSFRVSENLEEKKGLFQRLFAKKQQPLLEAR